MKYQQLTEGQRYQIFGLCRISDMGAAKVDRLPSPEHNVWSNYHIEGWQEGDDIEAVSVPVSVKSQ